MVLSIPSPSRFQMHFEMPVKYPKEAWGGGGGGGGGGRGGGGGGMAVVWAH